ncbi:general substrate transporter [Dacryopinax primogenitus]|uniref:General substrate transporter n=1 Tax=Dacryopinax primogenitus (strain DJM 731) TaxID=1858805 RepID=M5FPQ9_DACPD|nr:general substrate transporter [Dacryopinax primogenitus]EJT96559.1 general substrate transporter [Dacryopinax primogenitus]
MSEKRRTIGLEARSYSPWIASNPYIVGSFACIGGGLFGLDISSMSGVLNNPYWLDLFYNPQGDIQGAIVASMPAGSFVGAISVGWLADLLGRKRLIIIAGIIWVIGSILQCASINRGMLVVGRIISGISVGISSTVVPVYQAEITAPSIRGRIVSLQQWSITWGILIQYFIQFGCSYIDGVASFRIPWGLQMIPAIVLSVGMLAFPESPRYLLDNDRGEEALQILADLHGKGNQNDELVQLEYHEIVLQIEMERKEGPKAWKDMFAPGIFRRVFLGMTLQMWSQLTGMNVMMYYITYVFAGAGLTGRRANLIAASVQYVLNMVFTVPSFWAIDWWGRRPLLLTGTGLMSFFLFLVGGLQGGYGEIQYVADAGSNQWVIVGNSSVTYGIIVCSYLFVVSFSFTMGPVSWTYPSEIFPMKVRAKAVSWSTAANWAFNFMLAFSVPPAFNNIYWKTYMIFATFNAAAFIHIFFMFPETKGRTIEEMEEIFAAGHVFTAWNVGNDIGRHNLEEIRREVEGRLGTGTEKVDPELEEALAHPAQTV